jgi:lysophospholipase L1-like esterase
MLEILVRVIVGAPLKERLPLSRVMADPDVGWVMLPSDKHYTYGNYVTLNKLGLRDSEISTKLPHEYRILAIGDSHVYGQGVNEDGLLTTVLEQKLNKTGSSCRFNVINMGVRAYSTNNELALLKKIGFSLDPDRIMVFFYINDFIPVNIANRYTRFADMGWYTFDFSGKPEDKAIAKWKKIQLLRNSAFLMWIQDIYSSFVNRSNYINKLLLGELDDGLRIDLEKTINTLDEIRLLSEQRGVHLTLAVIPVSAQLTKKFPQQMYQSILKEYAENTEIDFVDLLPDLQSHYIQYQDSLVLPFDGHYNSEGHSVMAGVIFEHLRALDLCKE